MVAALAAASFARPLPAAVPDFGFAPISTAPTGSLTVMTYNVEGLPFPVAFGRASELAKIGGRLADLRRHGRQPHVVALQEAFIPEAKAIAAEAGYRYVATGPQQAEASNLPAGSQTDPSLTALIRQTSRSKGEADGKWVDSGLVIMSDYPIVATRRMAYPKDICAGYDCLAAKGVLLAWIRVPGQDQPIAIADTHLNSRAASGVPIARANAAYRAQLAQARAFIGANVPSQTSLVFAGDFNVGHDPMRVAAADAAMGSALGTTEASRQFAGAPNADLAAVVKRAKDKQYFRPGSGQVLHFTGAHVPFGKTNGGDTLSDHFGYVVTYSLR
ncbi:endonuclease/exonuclease/phosphatase family protein [Novosphingobium sp. PhB165]|uniref:endonuclease/exonuclease/phosphatase family protein n=1 Tax=Novosphingobium sp. PhB165 TaxID=2485105 RepID=UPI001FB2FC87|nr:endonuclease/exonuclease/phosphatase family protein [Novosphingobium sp. PhB165]